MHFYLRNFTIIKKTSCSVSGGALGAGVVVSADNGNDNVADNNVTN